MSCVLMAGCWGYQVPKGPTVVRAAPPPALIGHIVFVELENPDDYGSIRRSADSLLGTIPEVATYAAGGHLDTRRDSVRTDYDLAIYLGFASQEDLAAYVAHEQHIAFVNQWKPRLKSLRVYDMLDEPAVYRGLRCGIGGRKKFLGTF